MIPVTEEQSKINEAFERFFPADFSKARPQIVEVYGEEIAAQVDFIFHAALDAPVDWRTATMKVGQSAPYEMLVRQYPWLS